MHLPVTALQIWKSFPLPSNLSHLRQGFSGQMSLQWDRPWYFTRPTLHGSKVLPCPCLSLAQWHRDINGVRPCLPSTTKASQMVVVQVSLFWLPMGKPSLYETSDCMLDFFLWMSAGDLLSKYKEPKDNFVFAQNTRSLAKVDGRNPMSSHVVRQKCL